MKLHHIGLVVEAITNKARLQMISGLLGIGANIEVEGVPFRVVEWDCVCTMYRVGDVRIEMVEPGENCPFVYWPREQQSPIHHIAFEVSSLDRATRWARHMGYKTVSELPVLGVNGTLVNFIAPSNFGLLVELVEVLPGE